MRNISKKFREELITCFPFTTILYDTGHYWGQQLFYCCVFSRYRENVFTELLPINGRLLWLQYFGFQTLGWMHKHKDKVI
jgi:hypothetical protein